MAPQSEAALEQSTVDQFVALGYERAMIADEASLERNFRQQIQRFNSKIFANEPLSDSEFKRLLLSLKNGGIIDAAKMLRDKVVLQRDDSSVAYVQLFDGKAASRNVWQVAHQVTMVGMRENRYDVTVLANGLPVLQLELKRRGVELQEAFNQINRYRRETFQGLYGFLQLFVISNGSNTRYFANSPSVTSIPFSHAFPWTDEANNRLNELSAFINVFMKPAAFTDYLHRFMVVQDVGEKALIAFRPYQVHAVKSVLKQALDTGNNGFVWHATGSGKTLTSFKVASLLSEEEKFRKVVFLVDRKDLNVQTIAEFNRFSPNSVNEVSSSVVLAEQLKSKHQKLIVTTIQKLSNLVSANHSAVAALQDEPVLFMIDECHRSQFGDMHKQVKNLFWKAQYFGFTGTPLFPENRSQDGRTTADVFGRCLHQYLMKDAIADGNVLPFNIEYVRTVTESDDFQDDLVAGVDLDSALLHPERIRNVTVDVVQQFRKKSAANGYNAMLAANSVRMLGLYYRELKKTASELKSAAIFSFGPNEELAEGVSESSRDILDEVIADYNIMFGTNFDVSRFDEYFLDVQKRMKSGEIDILLVVGMMLTGFDAPNMNTLFVDKSLQYHSLLQAFSRVNRVGRKGKVANIRCYQPLKERTDAALRLFSQTDNVDQLLVRPYDVVLAELKKAFAALLAVVPTPAAVDLLEGEIAQQEFVLLFRAVNRLLHEIQPHAAFAFDKVALPVSENIFADFRSKYVDLKNDTDRPNIESVLNDIDFEMELIAHDRVNVDYILKLIMNFVGKPSSTTNEKENILKQIEQAADPVLRLKSSFLKKFLNDIALTLAEDADVEQAYASFVDSEFRNEVASFSAETDISEELIYRWVHEYSYSTYLDREEIFAAAKALKLPFRQKRELVNKVNSFIETVAKKY